MVNIYTCDRHHQFTSTLTLISTHRNWNATTSLPVQALGPLGGALPTTFNDAVMASDVILVGKNKETEKSQVSYLIKLAVL